ICRRLGWLQGEVTRRYVRCAEPPQGRLRRLADVLRSLATSVEPASRRRGERRRYLPVQGGVLAAVLRRRVRNRDRIDQALCVVMRRPSVQIIGRTHLDEFPEVKDADRLGEVPD